ncbi:MAG: TlpA family protein disulfide reductase [Dehalococcoidia bacterium]
MSTNHRMVAFLRWVVLPVNTVALTVLLIWALQSGRFPGLGRESAASSQGVQANFFSLSGQPLGAARGSGPGLERPAPEFALQDLDGRAVRLSDFRGKVVLVNFWATWCPPCRKEFPELVRAYDESGGTLVVLGVDLQENPDAVRKFAAEYGAKFPIVIDVKASVAEAYRVFGIPSSYFIDQQGVLRDEYFGAMTRKIIADKVAKTRLAGRTGG